MVDAEFTPDALARMARCMAFWQAQGYAAVSLPWIAHPDYTEATCPPGGRPQPTLGLGRLVASGEQSFLQMAHRKQLPDAPAYVGWSPCVRHEPVYDETHHLYFMKVELFAPVVDWQAVDVVNEMLHGSQLWMEEELRVAGLASSHLTLREVAQDQWDLEIAGLEVGSYGLREHFVRLRDRLRRTSIQPSIGARCSRSLTMRSSIAAVLLISAAHAHAVESLHIEDSTLAPVPALVAKELKQSLDDAGLQQCSFVGKKVRIAADKALEAYLVTTAPICGWGCVVCSALGGVVARGRPHCREPLFRLPGRAHAQATRRHA
jgi:hypothetical protein